MMINRINRLTVTCVMAMGAALPVQAAEITASYTPSSIYWTAPGDCAEAHVRVSGEGAEINRSFDSCGGLKIDTYNDNNQPLADGLYYYELTLVPREMVEDREALERAQENNDAEAVEELSVQLQTRRYSYQRDAGMFRVSQGLIGEYNEAVAEAEGRIEEEALTRSMK